MADPMPTQISGESTLKMTVDFTGGLEMLFDNVPSHNVCVPSSTADGSPVTIKFLIPWLVENLMSDGRKEMFVTEEGGIRPGILVLINEADWELEGEDAYELKEDDRILFVSTLHGG